MEKVTSTIQQLTLDVKQQKQTREGMTKEINILQAENNTLKANISDCQSYSRRWSLKVRGVREEDGDIRSRIIEILGKVATNIHEDLREGIDIASGSDDKMAQVDQPSSFL